MKPLKTERTKVCTRCQTLKPWSDYYPRTRWEDGSTRTVRAECAACSVRLHVQTRRTNERYRLRHAEQQEQYRRRRMATPEGAGLERARKREHERRKNGTQPDRYRVGVGKQHSNGRGGSTVPLEPFRLWLLTLGSTGAEIARRTDMAERRVTAVVRGEDERVFLDTVDRALLHVGDGTTLEDLYEPQDLAA